MSQIAYDPVKDKFAKVIRKNRVLRTWFYFILDTLFLRSWYVKRSLKTLKQVLPKDTYQVKILDAGCGFGQYDRFLLRQFPNAVIDAIDVKEEYLEDCRAYYNYELSNGKITFKKTDLLNFDDSDKYDIILCVDVLEHIENDVDVMQRLNKALKSNGYILMHSPSDLAKHDAGEDDFFVDEHARVGYSKEDLAQKLSKAGYEAIKIDYSYGKWGHLAWVLLIKWPMLSLNTFGFLSLLLFPIWYAVVIFPSLLLMKIDLKHTNDYGTGILGLAMKSASSPDIANNKDKK